VESRLDEFREFVNKYPLLRDEVKTGNRTWQNIYEEWVLYGEKDNWNQYREAKSDTKSTEINTDNIKNILGYIKKINPDSINKTLNTVQKVIQIVQTVGGPKGVGSIPSSTSLYSDWWD
jgi:hypothetical protein